MGCSFVQVKGRGSNDVLDGQWLVSDAEGRVVPSSQ